MRIARIGVSAAAIALLLLLPLRVRPHAVAPLPQTATAVSPVDVGDGDRRVTDMVRQGDLRLARVADDTLLEGRAHERYDQFYKGVRVFGGNTVRQMAGGQA